ncbi:hypothetical protein J6590_055373 [Homalodisca vitripennis]|nr:hypothetical protein J6590_055373 [Homalodisca vitripennis]
MHIRGHADLSTGRRHCGMSCSCAPCSAAAPSTIESAKVSLRSDGRTMVLQALYQPMGGLVVSDHHLAPPAGMAPCHLRTDSLTRSPHYHRGETINN